MLILFYLITDKMFALVKCFDNYTEICSKRDIIKRNGDECVVKYKGSCYKGQIVA